MIRRSLISLAKYNIRARTQHSQAFWFSEEKKQPTQPQSSDQRPQQTVNQKPSEQKAKKEEFENEYKQEEDFKYEEQNRNTVGWIIWRVLVWGSIGAFSYNCYLVANQTKQKKADQQLGALPGFLQAARTAHRSYGNMMEFFTEPPVKKLLADPLHPAIQPKTLCLNLSGTLIDTNFIIGKGMTLKRRPGLQPFLAKLSQMYEVIIFSDDDYMFLTTVIPTLDPRQQIFMGAFGRQCMVWYQGRYIKDIKYLNRDPRHVVFIDKDAQSVKKSPNNVIVLKQFHGQEADNELIKLLPLLENLANPDIKDVRKVLQKLGQNPHDKFYQKIKDKHQKIKAKQSSGIFGFFSNKKKQ